MLIESGWPLIYLNEGEMHGPKQIQSMELYWLVLPHTDWWHGWMVWFRKVGWI